MDMSNAKSDQKITIKPLKHKAKGLQDFLKKHAYDKSKHPIITNTRIADSENGIFGGSYYISEEEYPQFIEIYGQENVKKGKREYLTEKQLEKGGPILIDIDMRFDTSIKIRQYTQDHITDLIDIYLGELKTIFQFDEDTRFPIYVLEKPRVNCLKDKTKDGLHLIIGIQADRTTQVLLRKKVLPRLEETWRDSLPLINSWTDILDEGISIGHCNWQMYGSSKPNHETYAITHIYDIKFDSADQEFIIDRTDIKTYDIISNLYKLSARYPDNYSPFFTSAFSDEHSEYSGKTVNKKKSIVSPNVTNTIVSLFAGTSQIQAYASIVNREQLDYFMQEFLKSAEDQKDQETLEIYEYTMTLPPNYYESGSHDKWIRVGWCLRNRNMMYFIIWIYFSAQASNFDFGDIPNLFNRWDKTNMVDNAGLTKRSLMYWSKTDAPEKYKVVREKTLDYYLENTIDSPLSGLTSSEEKKPTGCGEVDLVEVLYHMKKDEFACVSVKDNVWYQYFQHRWEQIDSGTTLRTAISTDLRKEYVKKAQDLAIKIGELPEGDNRFELMNKRLDRIMAIIARLGKTGDKKNMMIEAKDKFYDGEFLKRLDTNPYLMCFRNGVWDFQEKNFRQGRPDDYLSITTGIDYIKNDPVKDKDIIEEVQQFMRQLFPVPQLEKYMWEHLASILIGVATDQTFNNYIGGGSNGKSVLTNLMGMVLGGYKYDLTAAAVTCKERTKVGGLAPEIVELKGKRYVVMAEPSKGDVINEGIMKQFTAGNDKITARSPYMLKMMEFHPQFKLVVCANQLLKIPTTDHGTWRRIRLVDFMSLFTNSPVDNDPVKPYQYKLIPDIEKKFDGKFKYVFMDCLVQIALKTGGKVEQCDFVLAASDRYRQSQDVISEFMNEFYVSCPGAKVLNKTCVSEDFKRWHMETYNSKGPQPKEVYEYMDRKYGKPSGGKWINVKRKEIIIQEDEGDMDEVNDVDLDE